jgi:hypothetical protein
MCAATLPLTSLDLSRPVCGIRCIRLPGPRAVGAVYNTRLLRPSSSGHVVPGGLNATCCSSAAALQGFLRFFAAAWRRPFTLLPNTTPTCMHSTCDRAHLAAGHAPTHQK